MDNNTPPIRPSLKALTVLHPYAHWIVIGEKTIEIRHSNTNYRGPLLIHAGKRVHPNYARSWNLEDYTMGAIVGRVTLDNSRRIGDITEFIELEDKHRLDVHSDDIFSIPKTIWAWELSNPVKFDKPIPYRGQLGIFNIPADVVS